MRSINARQLVAVGVSLLAFLGLTGVALDRAFERTATVQMQQWLQDYALQISREVEVLRSGELYIYENYAALDPRFGRPGSGLYAEVVSARSGWVSASGYGPELPDNPLLAPGRAVFDGPLPMLNLNGMPGQVYRYGIGIVSAIDSDRDAIEIPYSVYVMLDAGTLPQQLRAFRSALWENLGFAGVVLLLLQWLILRWSLSPLRQVVRELKQVQHGLSERMGGAYPRELEPLTDSINAMIESERATLERQRNTMSDLAHSLKTPLAVLRARLDSGDDEATLRREVATQCQRMTDLVSYQLGRAASGGHKLFSAPVEIHPQAELIVQGLEKIHAARGVLCEFEIDSDARFYGEVGDLQELLGNLLENAFKWAASRVLLTVRVGVQVDDTRPGLLLCVEDDGGGIPEDKIRHVLQRGGRADEQVHGHGIGLSIVQDIICGYRGELQVTRSQELGGARFEVTLPPGL